MAIRSRLSALTLADFYQAHAGETCLIVGCGPNLELTPPEWFDYPSFGVNTIYKRAGAWKPTYFVGVDERLRLEDGSAIAEKYADIPKFVPASDWNSLEGMNFFRFQHRPGSELYVGGRQASDRNALTKNGITYRRIMDAVFQIAWHMGFTTMLMIGVQHKPGTERLHFWGDDPKAIQGQGNDYWFDGYKYFSHGMKGVRVLNISRDTYVPDDVLPRGDWRNWCTPMGYEDAKRRAMNNFGVYS